MSLASQGINEVKRTVKMYDDVICVFFNKEDERSLEGAVNMRIEEILLGAYDLTDALIKMIKVEIRPGTIKPEDSKTYRLQEGHLPVVCYFKKGKLVARRYNTFNSTTLKSWIDAYFFSEDDVEELL